MVALILISTILGGSLFVIIVYVKIPQNSVGPYVIEPGERDGGGGRC